MPTRIQRTRLKGAKLPPNTICVTRPGVFSNPYVIGKEYWVVIAHVLVTPENCLMLYEEYARKWLSRNPNWLDPLREADHLACWCRPNAVCHGDILLKLLEETA